MEYQYCKNIFSNKQNLNAHQRTTKYCLKLQNKSPNKEFICDSCTKTFLSSTTLRRHKKKCCSVSVVEELNSKIKELTNKNNLLEDKCIMLTNQLNKTEESYKELSITAVKRPVNNTKNIQINNYIKNMPPLLENDIKDSVPMLTLEHHVKGAEGYAEYALEFPFKDKIVCVDTARNKIKYKNEEGDIIEDVGFKKMMTKLCVALKDRSFNLSQEHYEKLSDKFTEKEMDEYNFMETAMAITKCANGKENDFCNKIVRMISKGIGDIK